MPHISRQTLSSLRSRTSLPSSTRTSLEYSCLPTRRPSCIPLIRVSLLALNSSDELSLCRGCWGRQGKRRDKLGHLASPDVKQAMLWARDALRDIPEEVVKNYWRKAGILPFE